MLMPVQFHKAEKYALDMTVLPEETKTFFLQNFGCSRKVYNLYVDYLYRELEKAGYENGDKIPEIKFPEVTAFKEDYPFLKKADSLGLANAKQDFEDAVKKYRDDSDHKSYTKRALRRDESRTEALSFRGLKGMPKFHAKAKGHFSYTTNCQYPDGKNKLVQPTIRLEGNLLHLPKLKQDVKLVIHRHLPENARIGNVTLSMDGCGVIYASIAYSYTIQMEMSLREAAGSGDTSKLDRLTFLGLDYSQPDFYVDSAGRKANYPHWYRKSEGKVAKIQRKLSRMQKGSKNYENTLMRIRKLHTKIRNQRRDFLQKRSTELIRQYDVIVVEDINLRAMGGALTLGKNLHDNGFGMFRNMLSYKLERKGSVLVKVAWNYPSTKTCHTCGFVNPKVVLGISEWDCPQCGAHHLRDVNAAKNIEEEGRRIFLSYFREWLDEKALSEERAQKRQNGRKNKNKAAHAA